MRLVSVLRRVVGCEKLPGIGVQEGRCMEYRGGEYRATLYSMQDTAGLNGRNPKTNLPDVLWSVPEQPIIRIEHLLPWRTAVRHLSQSAGPVWSVAGLQRFRFRPGESRHGVAPG